MILVQVENEYDDPTPGYFEEVVKQFRNANITVPLINNNAAPVGVDANDVDIYGYDSYPLGFDCSHPTTWSDTSLPTNLAQLHEQQSPNTPHSIIEFQGGSYNPWGGPGGEETGFGSCTKLVGSEFERVYYKNNFASGVKLFNIYMVRSVQS